MALAPSSHPSLCSSPSLPRTTQIFFSSTKQLVFNNSNSSFLSSNSTASVSFRRMKQELKPSVNLVVKASETDQTQTTNEGGSEEEQPYEEYEVEIEQPYGLKFRKGRDGGTYIDAIFPGGAADKAGVFEVGDKVIATSAVFGTEIWPAAEYGRTMYTIRQRIGPLLMQMQKRYGKVDDGGELTEKEIIRAERNAGFISNRVREIQMQNYLRKKESKERRALDLREGLQLYKSGKYEEALEKFESVLGSRPEPEEASVASYNVACCYSKLNQIQAGLSALEDALKDGFEDFKRIRTDPDLENLRASEEFDPLLKRFDESFINENAINAIKSLFGFGKK
ncbi:hypothetical protein CCACVL1_23549 [Corchorus capsularis]|uniref:PDZ domain-containing protein n=1 Tax=Corchorus capsularis TaxID=210143 RepID=A0A1R3GTT2_COCAP|nr:hypothetical protein CCACVL1_23549 [Corchorus capsularis]